MAKSNETKRSTGETPVPQAPAKAPRYEIRTGNPTFTGERAGVRFVDGVGRTDDEAKARQCAEWGYKVSIADDDSQPQ